MTPALLAALALQTTAPATTPPGSSPAAPPEVPVAEPVAAPVAEPEPIRTQPIPTGTDREEPDPTVQAPPPPPSPRATQDQRGAALAGEGASPVQVVGGTAQVVSTAPVVTYRPPSVRPFEMGAVEGSGLVPPASMRPALPERPVTLDQYRASYELPKTSVELTYEQGVQARLAQASGRMGRLDGPWTVSAPDGSPLLALLVVDPGDGDEIEGAWRDLRRRAPVGDAGVLLSVGRDGEAVVVRFLEPGRSDPTVLRLFPEGGARWRGSLQRPGAAAEPVSASRG